MKPVYEFTPTRVRNQPPMAFEVYKARGGLFNRVGFDAFRASTASIPNKKINEHLEVLRKKTSLKFAELESFEQVAACKILDALGYLFGKDAGGGIRNAVLFYSEVQILAGFELTTELKILRYVHVILPSKFAGRMLE